MRLLLDIQATQSLEHGDRGIARYVAEHARALIEAGADVGALLLNPALPFPPKLPLDLLASPLLRWNTAAELADQPDAAAYFVMSPMEGVRAGTVLPPHVSRRGWAVVTTLYDLIPLILREGYLSGWRERVYLQRLDLLLQSDLVLAISEHTRSDGVRHLGLDPAKVVNVGGGVSPFFHPVRDRSLPLLHVRAELPAIDRPIVLSVGGGDARKNLDGLIRGWARVAAEVRAQHQLVIACKLSPAIIEVLEGVAAQEGLAPGDVVLTGYVDDQLLRSLYQVAELLVFASRYEGYGLPVAEAVACGCPAITSATTSLPEVLGWPGATFDPTSPEDLGRVATRALADPAFRAELLEVAERRRPEVTWAKVAERTLEGLEGLRPRRVAPRRRRPTIGVVGPVPPTDSGIATYNGSALAALAELAEVTVLDPVERGVGLEGCRVAPLRSLGHSVNPWSFDHLVYTLGNSAHHARSVHALRSFPGVAWLHEARLAGPYWATSHDYPHPDAYMVDRLREMYPTTPTTTDERLRSLPNELAQRGIGMTAQVVADATGLIVSSELGARLLQLDQRPGAALPPLEVLRHATPPPAAAPHLDGPRPVVAAFGTVDAVKDPIGLLRAVALLRPRHDVDLAFVGWIGEDWRTRLTAAAASLGLSDRLVLTGEVPRQGYDDWLRRATLGVQLRSTTYGESSGAVHDLLAHGVPCLTSVAACAELPPGTVELVHAGIGAEDLAARIAALLDDPARRAALREAGLHDARTWSFDRLAAELMAALERLRARAPGPPRRGAPGPAPGCG